MLNLTPSEQHAAARCAPIVRKPRAFLTSAHELPGGGYEREIPADRVWTVARALGLHRGDYGRSWFVYASKRDYLDSLD